jgi:hypothetical protein
VTALDDLAVALLAELRAQGDRDQQFALSPNALSAFDALASYFGEQPWISNDSSSDPYFDAGSVGGSPES